MNADSLKGTMTRNLLMRVNHCTRSSITSPQIIFMPLLFFRKKFSRHARSYHNLCFLENCFKMKSFKKPLQNNVYLTPEIHISTASNCLFDLIFQGKYLWQSLPNIFNNIIQPRNRFPLLTKYKQNDIFEIKLIQSETPAIVNIFPTSCKLQKEKGWVFGCSLLIMLYKGHSFRNQESFQNATNNSSEMKQDVRPRMILDMGRK